ncbi:hypothetical protein B0J14DRAFT_604352 [Halenospora varia]|nr:hypothetical protein B0J14DRAFT_604352 [Halenospora varia]
MPLTIRRFGILICCLLLSRKPTNLPPNALMRFLRSVRSYMNFYRHSSSQTRLFTPLMSALISQDALSIILAKREINLRSKIYI